MRENKSIIKKLSEERYKFNKSIKDKVSLIDPKVSNSNKQINWGGNFVYYSQFFANYISYKYNNVYVDKNNIVYINYYGQTSNLVYDPYTPKPFNKNTQVFKQLQDAIKKSKKQFIIIPISFCYYSEVGNISHANILLYDTIHNYVELFDSLGNTIKNTITNNTVYSDYIQCIKQMFSDLLKHSFTFHESISFMEKGYQNIEEDICKTKLFNVNTPIGFCVVWSYWYIDMRLKYPKLSYIQLNNSINKIFNDSLLKLKQSRKTKNSSEIIKSLPICNVIRNYTIFITNLEHKISMIDRISIKWKVYYGYYKRFSILYGTSFAIGLFYSLLVSKYIK